MKEILLRDKLCELLCEIGSSSNGEHSKVAKAHRGKTESEEASFGNLSELLDNLGIGVKYLLFDLEATRRENAYLRERLEDTMK